MKRLVSLRDIATRAGVSPMAVSLALRNHPRVSLARRQQIAQVAAEMGYRPSLAQSIAASQRRKGGAGARMMEAALVRPPDFRGQLDGEARRDAGLLLERHGFHAQFFDASGMPPERAGEALQARGVEAILVEATPDTGFHARFPWEKFVSVGIMTSVARWRIDWVYVDLARAIRELTLKARQCGYTRIGFAFLREATEPPDHVEKLGAAWLAHAESPPSARIPPLETGISGCGEFREWLGRNRPDCVIGQVPLFHDWLPAKDKVGFGCVLSSYGVVTGWTQGISQVLATAARVLETKVRHHETGIPARATRFSVAMVWNEGSTLAPRKR